MTATTDSAPPADAAAAPPADDSGSHGIHVFAAPSDAPRVRWRTDLISAAFSAVLTLVLILVAGNGSTVDDNALDWVGTLPGWLRWLAQAAYAVGVLYGVGLLVGVGIFAKGRLQVLRDMLLAAGFAVVLVVVLTQLIDRRWPEFAFFDLNETRETFPAFFVTISVAIQAAASPWLTAPMRKLGWTFILAATAASILGGVTTLSDALGAILVALFAAAITRYAFGTSAGLPSTGRVRDGLADLDVEVDSLSYTDHQPPGSVVLSGISTDGQALLVSVLGRDSWTTRRFSRWWKEAWYQDHGAQYGSDRRQQVEHESLALLLADQDGMSVPALVTVGMTALDDAMLVTDLPDHTLADVPLDEVGDDLLADIWGELDKLHRAGISHGSIDASHLWFDPAGQLRLAGFGDSTIHPSDDQLQQDVAATLVMTTMGVGADRAIAAARKALGDDALATMLPLLQTAALNHRLRHNAKHQKLKIENLRKQTAAALDVDVPEVEQLTRVTVKSVVMFAFIGFAVYSIVAGLAEVGFATIWNTLSDARWGLVILALFLANATNFTDSIAVRVVAPKKLPVGVTTVEQFAIGFVDMAVPAGAGKIATNVRYFQKFGMGAVSAGTTGGITMLMQVVAQVTLIALALLVGSDSMDLSSMSSGDGEGLKLIGMIVVILVGVAVAVAVVPKWRHWVEDKTRKPLKQIRASLKTIRNPRTLISGMSAAVGTEVLYGAGLMASVFALGGSISIGEAIFINVVVSLVSGISPVPGNAGVAEAGLTAGLTAIGIDSNIAVSAVLVYRLVGTYLPPIWGYFSMSWLKQHDYL